MDKGKKVMDDMSSIDLNEAPKQDETELHYSYPFYIPAAVPYTIGSVPSFSSTYSCTGGGGGGSTSLVTQSTSNRKRPKIDLELDYFSLLPDPILFMIISLLPFDQIGQMATLGRRWRHFILAARRIDLDEFRFLPRRALPSHGSDAPSSSSFVSPVAGGRPVVARDRNRFVEFARRFYEGYMEPSLVSFRLRFSLPMEYEEEVGKWISIASARGAESLDLDFSDPEVRDVFPGDYMGYFNLPKHVVCLRDTLTSLSLSGCLFDPMIVANLHRLLDLTIARVELSHQGLRAIMKGCRVLKRLSLKKCSCLDLVYISDRHGTLESLAVEDCRPIGGGLRVKAPRLREFKYYGVVEYIYLKAPRLREVELDFGLERQQAMYGQVLVQLLDGFGSVRVLTVCSYLTQVIHYGDDNGLWLPIPNVVTRHLKLKNTSLHNDELPGILLLLRSYPFLKYLTVDIGKRRPIYGYQQPDAYDPGEIDLLEAQRMYPVECVKNHLRGVHINGYSAKEDELTFLRYLVMKARKLEEVKLTLAKGRQSRMERLKANTSAFICLYRRASALLRVVYC